MYKKEQTDQFNNRFKKFEKQSSDSLKYVLVKLGVLFKALECDGKIESLSYNFLRYERDGVYAVRCSSKGKRPLRLYIHLHLSSETIYLLTLGDKNTQSDDIRWCASIVKEIKAGNYDKHTGSIY